MSWDKPTAGALIEVQEVGTKLFGGGALSSKEKEREEEEVMMRCITRSIMLKEGLHHDRAGDLNLLPRGGWEAGWPAMTSLELRGHSTIA